ncbi:MAG: gamma-glutamyltransferase family protein [Rhodobacteraceae bacterium]|nr:gamma-glutamyltransferase family protein [Paracoccaceae bacterium]
MRDFQKPGRSAVLAANGICATSHPLAALTAVDCLKAGGNAVDAAIAAAVLLGLAEPPMTGLGGDCFVLIKPAGREDVLTLNGSGRAPAGFDAEALRAQGLHEIAPHSAHAVTVPGAVDAFCALADRFGAWPLDRTLAPAIRYAEEGIPVAPRVAFDWARSGAVLNPAGQLHYSFGGSAPRMGQIFRAPGQAEILRRIARDGREGFYAGATADEMVTTLRAAGGCHSLDDFAATTAEWGTPISGSYRGAEILEHPPNGQGATALLMANILAQFDLSALDPMGADRAHLEAEAAKLAYDARNRFLADAAFTARLDHMLAPDTAAALAALIDPARALPTPPAAAGAVHKETVYLTVIDRNRMVVSLIYSIFHDFGSGIATPEHGILFHNRGAGFSLERGHPNEAAGGKRPMHTIIPAMLRENGRVTLPFGVMGGAYQPTGHARLVSNLRDFGMDIQSAIDAPRAFSDAGAMKVERGYSDAVRADLAERGHRVTIPEVPIGGAQAVRIDHELGILEGASDPRKDGCALGY